MSNINYRPVSYLPFLSKLVEKCVLIQFNNHLKLNTLNAEHQSAYKEGHSCETLLMKIDNDIQWAMDYLQDHRFHVVVEDMISKERTINYSVPQGSLLGPVLFNCYCSTLHEEIPKTLQLNVYADDHSMQISFKPDMAQESDSKSLLENSMLQTENGMPANRLKLNPKKTEFILFGSKCN